MLETIREYAAERLARRAPSSAPPRAARTPSYFADFARRQWEDLTADRRDAAPAALAAETENLRLAWRHWVGERDLDQLNKLVDSLWLLYESQGRYQGMVDLTRELLDVCRRRRPRASARSTRSRCGPAWRGR